MEIALALIVLCTVLFNMGLSFWSLLYNKYLYRRFYVPRFDSTYTPKAAVFVPCKGMEENLDMYLQAMVTQDYPDYTVSFITESEEDPAVPVIREVIGKYPHSRHVVAGRTERCCQKNHNLLKAIETDEAGEIFIFADADVKPTQRWIRDLILPLSSKDIPISTGFRWLTPKTLTFWGTIHSMMSAYICTLMSSSKGVWGGSMAIRRAEYEKFKVGEAWSDAVVDDIRLTQIIIRQRLKRIFVPHCIAVSNNVLTTFRDNLDWFARQLMFLKVYCRPLWLVAIIVHGLMALLMVATIIVVPLSFHFERLQLFSLSLDIFALAFIFSIALIKFNYRDTQSALLWALFAIPGQMVGFLSFIKSALDKNILWRNILYILNADGSVGSIRFPDKT
jgi:ceramide glucosyltransferase